MSLPPSSMGSQNPTPPPPPPPGGRKAKFWKAVERTSFLLQIPAALVTIGLLTLITWSWNNLNHQVNSPTVILAPRDQSEGLPDKFTAAGTLSTADRSPNDGQVILTACLGSNSCFFAGNVSASSNGSWALEVTLLPIHQGDDEKVYLRLDIVTPAFAKDRADEKKEGIRTSGYDGFEQGLLPQKPLYAVTVFRAAPQ